MSATMFATVVIMILIAISFVAAPMLRSRAPSNQGNAKVALLAVVAIVVIAIALYATLGRPDLNSATVPASESAEQTTASTTTESVGSVASLTAGLEERLQQNPDDGKGWLLLAKTYDHLGEEDKVAAAYSKAVALGVSDLDFEQQLLHQAIVPQAESADVADQSAMARPVSDSVSIRGRVSLTADAMSHVQPGDTVFVTARAVDGPPVPIAVIRRTAADLPFDFVLDDSTTMVAGRGLSSISTVQLSAKVSRSGDALEKTLGLDTLSEAIRVADAPFVELLIDKAAGNE